MTELMWFIYLASVLPSFAAGLAFIFGFVAFFFLAFWSIWKINYSDYNSRVTTPPSSKLLVIVFSSLFLCVCVNLVPDKETLYLMAGAKGAEVAITSEAGQEILGDIQEVIRYQLQELKQKPLTGQ